jgi:hypothetical protein
MKSEELFKGQNPEPKDKSKLRLIRPIYLKDCAFAFDLWEFYGTEKKGFQLTSLYYEGMRNFINSKDFYKRQLTKQSHIYIKSENNIIDEVTPQAINDEVRSYVDSFQTNVEFEHNHTKYSIPHHSLRNVYLRQHHNIINPTWLTNIQRHETPILKDNENNAYFVFQNGFVDVTKDSIELKDFSELNGCSIWRDQIIQRHFQYIPERHEQGEFEKFITNVCNAETDRFSSLCSAIGYLLHNYFNPTKGQAVILYDEALTTSDKPSGGTGKGLIVNAIKTMRPTAKIDGKNYKSEDKFKWSNVTPSTQIVWIDETNKNFNFVDLFSCLTDGWQIERKHQNKFDIAPEDSPKVVICSNTILDNKGSSNKRRQFIVELSDYYSKKIIHGTETPIQDEHKMLFSNDWTSEEWNKFYSFMLDCLKYYLKNGLMNYKRKNIELNLLKQKTCDEFLEYITNTPPPIGENIDLKPLFEEFKLQYFGEDSQMKQRTFTNWIKMFCAAKNYEFISVGKKNGNPYYQIREQGNNIPLNEGGDNEK